MGLKEPSKAKLNLHYQTEHVDVIKPPRGGRSLQSVHACAILVS